MKRELFVLATLIGSLLVGCGDKSTVSETIPDLKAQGNEPFWTITTDVKNQQLRYQTPMHLEGELFSVNAEVIADGWRFSTLAGERKVLTVTKQECQDNMSGWVFTYTATLEQAGSTYLGCANPLGVEPEQSEDD